MNNKPTYGTLMYEGILLFQYGDLAVFVWKKHRVVCRFIDGKWVTQ